MCRVAVSLDFLDADGEGGQAAVILLANGDLYLLRLSVDFLCPEVRHLPWVLWAFWLSSGTLCRSNFSCNHLGCLEPDCSIYPDQ